MEALKTFLYVLMRDHLPVGVVEQIVTAHVEPGLPNLRQYSNSHLAANAQELADRICRDEDSRILGRRRG